MNQLELDSQSEFNSVMGSSPAKISTRAKTKAKRYAERTSKVKNPDFDQE